MRKNIDFKININIKDFIDQWARQAGYYCRNTNKEYAQKQYIDALHRLFKLFCKHHKEIRSDSEFIKIFRFFVFLEDEVPSNLPIDVQKRYEKLKGREPDMGKL